jgi:two-component system phosphate regulon sensor histidine kinase PhoR
MAKRRLFYQLIPSYLIITLTAVISVGWFALRLAEQFGRDQVATELQDWARTFSNLLPSDWTPNSAPHLIWSEKVVASASGLRVALVLPSGRILYRTGEKPVDAEEPIDRPEITGALNGNLTIDIRYVPDRGQRVSYLALPVVREGQVIAVIQASQPLGEIGGKINRMRTGIVLVGIAMIVLGGLLSYWMSRRISRPINEIRQGAERFARGDLEHTLPIPESEELAGLAEALNEMAVQLQERIQMFVRQTNEQKAIVGSMVEGLLAVDHQERIISLNKSCCQLLGVEEGHAHGRSLQEVVRNADLRRFVTRVLSSEEAIDDDVVLHGNSEGVLQARGAALHDASGRGIGAVVVLNDVTEFRRLEHIRRDFVANVSHELKTPITSIKGFVETLLDGAMQDPVDTERFLTIVARQADRLNAIIEDLLSLSKVEQGEEEGDIVLLEGQVVGVLASAVHECTRRASARDIQLRMTCNEDLIAQMNAPLLEQAVINLLDNAIQYSDPGSEVQLLGRQSEREIAISVADTGCGISAEHLPRIFERFYRVDRARSRKLGGTGLGLAIVKHIVQAHGGHVSVKSSVGNGSTFTLHLPRPAQGPKG